MYMLFLSKTLLKLTKFFYCIREVQFWRQKYTVTSLIEPRVNILKMEVFPIEWRARAISAARGKWWLWGSWWHPFTKRLLPFSSLPHSFASILQCYAYQLSSIVVRKYKGISVFQFLFLLTSCAMLMSVQWDWRLLWGAFGLSVGFATLDHTDAAVGPLTSGRNQSICLLSGRYFLVQEGSKRWQFLNTEKKW